MIQNRPVCTRDDRKTGQFGVQPADERKAAIEVAVDHRAQRPGHLHSQEKLSRSEALGFGQFSNPTLLSAKGLHGGVVEL